MSYIQLIEKAVMPTSLWLTFWDLSDSCQLSLEIAAAAEIYDVGAVFSLDRDATFERLALKPLRDPDVLSRLPLLVPLAVRTERWEAPVVGQTASIHRAEGATTRIHEGLISFLN